MKYLELKDSDYGALLPYLKDNNVTDINWNGIALWIDDLNKGRYKTDIVLTNTFIELFSQKVSNSVNVNFNKYKPLLEAETDELRISILHESVTNSGYSISIRKTPPIRRIVEDEAITDGYCTKLINDFMKACVEKGMSIIICGIPGTGKTEYLKYLTQFIPSNEKVITIEDNLEIRYHKINPNKDSIEIKVDDDFTYSDAIKASLRQAPKRILLSESRGKEVIHLLESSSTGTSCMTTLHTDTVRKIPDRIVNMMGIDGKGKENNIFSFFNIGVLIKKEITNEGITRRVAQICIFDRDTGVNRIQMIYEDGQYFDFDVPFDFKEVANILKERVA